MRARDVVALLSPELKEQIVREVTRIRCEWYRLPIDERLALEKAKRERQENDRRIRNEYRIQKAGGAL